MAFRRRLAVSRDFISLSRLSASPVMAASRGRFSGDGGLYATIGDDGRVRVWRCAFSGPAYHAPDFEVVPDENLEKPQCLAWLRLGPQPLKKRSDDKSKQATNGDTDVDENYDITGVEEDSSSSTHLAIGMWGKIVIYSLASATVETVLEDGDDSKRRDQRIVCVDWDPKYGLYSLSIDSTVKEWNITENKVNAKFNMNKILKDKTIKITAMKLVPHCKNYNLSKQRLMLTASCQLRLWCLKTKTVLHNMVGHSNSVYYLNVLCFPQESNLYVVSGSKNDRILSVWCVNVSEEDDDLNVSTDSKDEEHLNKSESKKRRLNRRSASDGATNEIIANPHFNFLMEDIPRQVSCNAMSDDVISVCVVTRSGVVHYYEQSIVESHPKPLKPKTTVQIATEEGDAVKPLSIVCSCLVNNEILIGYMLDVGLVFEHTVLNLNEKMTVLIRNQKQEKLNKKERAKRETETATKIKHTDDKDSSVVYLSSAVSRGDRKQDLKRKLDGKQGDIPMESRLQNLSVSETGNQQVTDSNNLAQLLIQALHSNDKSLLQTVFECRDPEIAYNSINRLPIHYISPLVDHLIDMLGGKSNQCRSACLWADALCKAKSSSLLALGSSSNKLKELQGALGARLASLPNLLGLKARLGLALHKLSESTTTTVLQVPLLDYKDTSSEDEMADDMEDALKANMDDDSASSWNEDDDDDDSSKQSDQNMSDAENDSENNRNVKVSDDECNMSE